MVLTSFPYWLMMLNICSCSYLPSVYNLWSSVYSNLLFIFNWVVCFLSVVLRDLYIFCEDIYKPFVEYVACQFLFHPICSLSFHFLNSVSFRVKVLNFDELCQTLGHKDFLVYFLMEFYNFIFRPKINIS